MPLYSSSSSKSSLNSRPSMYLVKKAISSSICPKKTESSLISPDHLSFYVRPDAVAYSLWGKQIHPPAKEALRTPPGCQRRWSPAPRRGQRNRRDQCSGRRSVPLSPAHGCEGHQWLSRRYLLLDLISRLRLVQRPKVDVLVFCIFHFLPQDVDALRAAALRL